MKIFFWEKNSTVAERIMGLDPGVKTTGFSLFDMATHSFSIGKREWDIPVLTLSLPTLIAEIHKQTEDILNIVTRTGAQEVIMEYPHLRGSFSLALAVELSHITMKLRTAPSVIRTTFVPNRIPEFFLKERSVSGKETVEYAEELSSGFKWYGKKCVRVSNRVSVHECDALLFALIARYDLIAPGFAPFVPRKPELEWIRLEA